MACGQYFKSNFDLSKRRVSVCDEKTSACVQQNDTSRICFVEAVLWSCLPALFTIVIENNLKHRQHQFPVSKKFCNDWHYGLDLAESMVDKVVCWLIYCMFFHLKCLTATVINAIEEHTLKALCLESFSNSTTPVFQCWK